MALQILEAATLFRPSEAIFTEGLLSQSHFPYVTSSLIHKLTLHPNIRCSLCTAITSQPLFVKSFRRLLSGLLIHTISSNVLWPCIVTERWKWLDDIWFLSKMSLLCNIRHHVSKPVPSDNFWMWPDFEGLQPEHLRDVRIPAASLLSKHFPPGPLNCHYTALNFTSYL